MKRIVKDQILKVRDTGEVNMFDANGVMHIANREGWIDLVLYLMDRRNRSEYANFIISGNAPIED